MAKATGMKYNYSHNCYLVMFDDVKYVTLQLNRVTIAIFHGVIYVGFCAFHSKKNTFGKQINIFKQVHHNGVI